MEVEYVRVYSIGTWVVMIQIGCSVGGEIGFDFFFSIVALFPFVEGFPAVLLLVLSPPLFSALLPVVFLLLPLPPPRAEEDEVDILPPLSLGPAFVASVVFSSFFSLGPVQPFVLLVLAGGPCQTP